MSFISRADFIFNEKTDKEFVLIQLLGKEQVTDLKKTTPVIAKKINLKLKLIEMLPDALQSNQSGISPISIRSYKYADNDFDSNLLKKNSPESKKFVFDFQSNQLEQNMKNDENDFSPKITFDQFFDNNKNPSKPIEKMTRNEVWKYKNTQFENLKNEKYALESTSTSNQTE